MASDIEAFVVEFGGKSYIKFIAPTYAVNRERIAANGRANLSRAPGDDSFLVYDGQPVETLERLIPPRRIVTKYRLRDDLRGATKDECISVDQHSALPDSDAGLYEPVHEEIPQKAEAVPFVVETEGGPPLKMPAGVVCLDRNYFARLPSFWHLGPVRATPRLVLYRVAIRLQEIIGDNPYVEWSWRTEPEEILRDRYTTSVSIRVRSMQMEGLQISAALKTSYTIDREKPARDYQERLKAVDGESLEDLEAKLGTYVENVTAPARKWAKPNACPCCGRRFAKDKNPIRPKERSR